MAHLEVEIKAFLSQKEYDKLLEFFHQQAEFINEDTQNTYYFDSPAPLDLRIQHNNSASKIILKKGGVHDEIRDECEILCDRDYFEQLEELFTSLGYAIKVKWFRIRNTFNWGGITVTLDRTQHYGNIIELEKTADPEYQEEVITELKQKLQQIGILLTSKDEFEKKYKEYLQNWRSYNFER